MDYKWKDHYFQKAKEEGFKSRAAFKLIEINNKHKILRRGYKVLDLGSAPGGWVQVALNSVGKEGFVYGVDRVRFEMPERDNLLIVIANIEDGSEIQKVVGAVRKKVDVVLSDMAPKLSGIRDADNARLIELAEIGLLLCRKLLKEGGAFLLKTFQSNEINEFRSKLKMEFEKITMIVPLATRRASSETYILARGFKGV